MSASSPSTPLAVWRLEFLGPNNSIAEIRLFIGQRVRVEVEAQATATQNKQADTPLSVADELALTSKATVRYIGPVAAAKDPNALMVGIEWDESGRGKNDGSVKAVRYFQCAPGQGSFIHPARIRVGAVSLTQAIAAKYEARFKADAGLYLIAEHNKRLQPHQHHHTAGADGVSSVDSPAEAAPRHIPVTFQGEEYMQGRIAAKLHTLVDMTLTQGEISLAFDPHSDDSTEAATLIRKIPNAETMDLTDNLINSWQEVAKIPLNLTKLKLLALSSNHLRDHTLLDGVANGSSAPSLAPIFSSAFLNLHVLVLNSVPNGAQAAGLLARQKCLPNLEELHLCKNDLTDLKGLLSTSIVSESSVSDVSSTDPRDILAAAFPNLTTIELSFNNITAWEEVRTLERLPKLTTLLLNSNGLAQVTYESNPSSSSSSAAAAATSSSFAAWSALSSIGLNSNRLLSFDSVSSLARFPSLKELRLRENVELERLTMELNAGGAATANKETSQAIQDVIKADEANKICVPESIANGAPSVSESSSVSSGVSSVFTATPQSASLLRLQLVARLPQLSTLNRSRISARERVDAEKYYVLIAFQNYGRRSDDQLQRQFERYAALVSEHGDPAATVDALAKQLVEPTGSTLASKLIQIHMVLAEESAIDGGQAGATAGVDDLKLPGLIVRQVQTKKLSSSLTIQAARTLLEKAFKIPAHAKARFALRYRDTQEGENQILDEPLKNLNYFGVTNGGYIILMETQK